MDIVKHVVWINYKFDEYPSFQVPAILIAAIPGLIGLMSNNPMVVCLGGMYMMSLMLIRPAGQHIPEPQGKELVVVEEKPKFQVNADLRVFGLTEMPDVERFKTVARKRLRIAHPDHGGSSKDFQRVHEAYTRLLEMK